MNAERREVWIQITAGQGPMECAWAVVKVLCKPKQEASASGYDVRTLHIEPGPEAGTAYSALVSVSGPVQLDAMLAKWRGTVQYVARSPFRSNHKRKNWFVGVDVW